MKAKAILAEMLGLVKAEIEAVIRGDYQALTDGVARHEALLSALATAEIDGTPEEMKALHDELNTEKQKLQSLLATESVRVDFLLRLMLGGGPSGEVGYPTQIRAAGGARMLNRRT